MGLANFLNKYFAPMINRTVKRRRYNEIVRNNPSLDINHLLNPYLNFNEYTQK